MDVREHIVVNIPGEAAFTIGVILGVLLGVLIMWWGKRVPYEPDDEGPGGW